MKYLILAEKPSQASSYAKAFDKTISASDIKALLRKGKTRLIKGFKSKKGTKFDAYLKLEDNKVGFEFAKKK
ncbi:topoisomerase C-terminal repeat-containing protein [Staphylococcus pseudintermedius]|uniref:topoisomerase C-terminal repeat-containing protein n=1 Tax=Staphylococcus pseudintermedius TaxID=283734 RepID=UPI002ED8DF3A